MILYLYIYSNVWGLANKIKSFVPENDLIRTEPEAELELEKEPDNCNYL